MHNAIRNCLLVSVLLFLTTACGDGRFGGQSSGRVAVVDLDKIAAATGDDKRMGSRVQKYAKEKEAELGKLRDESRAKIEKLRKQLPDNASDDAKRKLATTIQKLEGELRQELAKAQQGAREMRGKLGGGFRDDVEPVARRIAADRGMDIVMIKQNAMLYVDPKADITDAVIDALLTSDKKAEPAAEPADAAAK